MNMLLTTCVVSSFALIPVHANAAASVSHDPPVSAALREYESALRAVPTVESLRAMHDVLAAAPHVAGTPGDERVIQSLMDAFTRAGLEVVRHDIWVYLSSPVSASVEVVSEDPAISLAVSEAAVAGDPHSAHPDLPIGFNAYSGSGEATGEVVYANYGTKADFAKLKELGIDLTGKVVIARYGGNYRGFKAKFAEAAGAAALIIYTDPADSGYARGLMYPEGGFANEHHIQRGSIVTLGYSGDPLTPFIPATENAERLKPEELALPKIPVQPMGWAAAEEILSRMEGAAVPAGWQGGLPFAYRVTGGAGLRVRVSVEQRRSIVKTANVIASIKGKTHPDQKIIIGAHHDAWCHGASDPLAGTICVVEAAKAFGELAKKGQRPDRTVVFAAWAAEEHGIVGSTEWVEANADDLLKNAVAYFNMDMAAMGPNFGSSASPSLRSVIAAVAGDVPQPGVADTTVLGHWLARSGAASGSGLPAFGDLGGGSDHVGFLCHLGIPCASLGASGSQGTSYHSNYDNLTWYRKVVGDDYLPALMLSRVAVTAAARIACAPVLPLDPRRVSPETRRHLAALTRLAQERGLVEPPSAGRTIADEWAELEGLTIEHERAAERVVSRLQAAATAGRLTPEASDRIGALLISSERQWLTDAGIPGRPWFRSMYAATDEDSGYAEWMLPALRHAIEHGDGAALSGAKQAYSGIFRKLLTILAQIDAAIPAEPTAGATGAGSAGASP